MEIHSQDVSLLYLHKKRNEKECFGSRLRVPRHFPLRLFCSSVWTGSRPWPCSLRESWCLLELKVKDNVSPMGERSQTQSSCSLKAAWLPESENGSDPLSETSPGLQTHSDSLWKASSECQVKTGLEFLHFCMLAFVCFHTKSRRGASGSQGSLSTMCSFKDSFKWKFVNTFQMCLQKAGLVRKACWKLLKTSGSTRTVSFTC